jgi:hypothetical protein
MRTPEELAPPSPLELLLVLLLALLVLDPPVLEELELVLLPPEELALVDDPPLDELALPELPPSPELLLLLQATPRRSAALPIKAQREGEWCIRASNGEALARLQRIATTSRSRLEPRLLSADAPVRRELPLQRRPLSLHERADHHRHPVQLLDLHP